MITCPKCDAPLDVEEDELDEGDRLSCDECGASLTVTSVNPVEIESEEDATSEDDFDFDEDDEDDDDDEEEEDAGEEGEEDWH